jgi:hypothetical protein
MEGWKDGRMEGGRPQASREQESGEGWRADHRSEKRAVGERGEHRERERGGGGMRGWREGASEEPHEEGEEKRGAREGGHKGWCTARGV